MSKAYSSGTKRCSENYTLSDKRTQTTNTHKTMGQISVFLEGVLWTQLKMLNQKEGHDSHYKKKKLK